jgi:hypothetical protein
MAGKIVMEQKRQVLPGINKTVLDVHELQQGYYLVKVPTLQGDAIQKLVIQR